MKLFKQVIFLILLLNFTANAEDIQFLNKGGVAIDGYDPVSFFKKGKSEKGDREFSVQWKGLTWFFSSQEHKKLFEKSTDRYVPEFYGYCPYAVTLKRVRKGKPTLWRIYQDKLYFSFDKTSQNKFKKDPDGILERAKEHWEDVKIKIIRKG